MPPEAVMTATFDPRRYVIVTEQATGDRLFTIDHGQFSDQCLPTGSTSDRSPSWWIRIAPDGTVSLGPHDMGLLIPHLCAIDIDLLFTGRLPMRPSIGRYGQGAFSWDASRQRGTLECTVWNALIAQVRDGLDKNALAIAEQISTSASAYNLVLHSPRFRELAQQAPLAARLFFLIHEYAYGDASGPAAQTELRKPLNEIVHNLCRTLGVTQAQLTSRTAIILWTKLGLLNDSEYPLATGAHRPETSRSVGEMLDVFATALNALEREDVDSFRTTASKMTLEHWGFFHRAAQVDPMLAHKVLANPAAALNAARKHFSPQHQRAFESETAMLLAVLHEVNDYMHAHPEDSERFAFTALAERTSVWSRALREAERAVDGTTASPSTEFAVTPLDGVTIGDYRLVQLTSIAALREEGATMEHCVGEQWYVAKCSSGKSTIYSVQNRTTGERVATLECNSGFRVKQCLGKGNTTVDAEITRQLQYAIDAAGVRGGYRQRTQAWWTTVGQTVADLGRQATAKLVHQTMAYGLFTPPADLPVSPLHGFALGPLHFQQLTSMLSVNAYLNEEGLQPDGDACKSGETAFFVVRLSNRTDAYQLIELAPGGNVVMHGGNSDGWHSHRYRETLNVAEVPYSLLMRQAKAALSEATAMTTRSVDSPLSLSTGLAK